jgi:hypothetical protein
LSGLDAVRLGDPVQRPAVLRQATGGHREPRDEADALALAIREDGFCAAVREVVEVLHRRDRRDRSRRSDLGFGDLGESDASDLALGLQVDQCAELFRERDPRIDAVQLEQLDAFHAEQAKALLRLGLEVLRFAVALPEPRTGSRQTRLRRNDELVRVRMQRLADDALAHLGAVRVGGVDERHAQLDGAAKNPDHLVVVTWLAPHSGPRDLHGPVSQPHHRQVAADGELAARTSRLRRRIAHVAA